MSTTTISITLLILLYTLGTYQRNDIWSDETTLWADTTRKSPHKARPYFGLGYSYMNKGQYNNAIEQLKDSIEFIRSVQNERNQPVSFASTHVLTLSYFPKIANFLEKEMSKFSSKLNILDAYDSLKLMNNGMCDFLLGFADYIIDNHNFDTLRLGQIELVPVCKPADDGTPLFSLDNSVVDVPILDYRSNIYLGEKVREIRGRMLSTSNQRIRFRPLVESTMADTLKALAISGLGIAWIPQCNIISELSQSQLVICGDGRWQTMLDVTIYRDNKPKNEYTNEVWQSLLKLAIDNESDFTSIRIKRVSGLHI